MLRRGVRIVHDDAAAEVAPERRHRVEGEDGARRRAVPTTPRPRGARASRQERGRPPARRGREPAPSARARARAGRGTQAKGPQGDVQPGVHQAGPDAAATTISRRVAPISIRSPGPTTASRTGSPLTPRPVRAPEVGEDEPAGARRQAGVASRGQRVREHDLDVGRRARSSAGARRGPLPAPTRPGASTRSTARGATAGGSGCTRVISGPPAGRSRRTAPIREAGRHADLAGRELGRAEEGHDRPLRDPVTAPPRVVEGRARQVVLERREARERGGVGPARPAPQTAWAPARPPASTRRSSSMARSRRRTRVTGSRRAPSRRAVGRSKSRSRKRSSAARGRIERGRPPCGASGDAARDDRGRPGVPRSPGRSDPYGILSAPRMGRRDPRRGRFARGPDDGHHHRVVLRAVRHALLVRAERGASARPDRARPGPHARPQELRRERRHADERGDGRGAARRGPDGRLAPARRVPPDVQLLHVLPAVHVRQLLEREGRRVPDVRTRPVARGPARALPRPSARWSGPRRWPGTGRRALEPEAWPTADLARLAIVGAAAAAPDARPTRETEAAAPPEAASPEAVALPEAVAGRRPSAAPDEELTAAELAAIESALAAGHPVDEPAAEPDVAPEAEPGPAGRRGGRDSGRDTDARADARRGAPSPTSSRPRAADRGGRGRAAGRRRRAARARRTPAPAEPEPAVAQPTEPAERATAAQQQTRSLLRRFRPAHRPAAGRARRRGGRCRSDRGDLATAEPSPSPPSPRLAEPAAGPCPSRRPRRPTPPHRPTRSSSRRGGSWPPRRPVTPPASWPDAPAWPTAEPGSTQAGPLPGSAAAPWASRLATARPEPTSVWAASSQEVLAAPGPSAATRPGTPAVQACVSCGLSLSANARFCRRCGSRQG